MQVKPELLVTIYREGFIEKLHHGFTMVIDDAYNVIHKQGEDANTAFPFRSSAKPLQASAVIDSGAFEHFGLNHEELAVICSSHTGTVKHINVVREILKKIGLAEQDLHCGTLDPLDKEKQASLIRIGEEACSIHNNCSGKHSGMLAACVKNGWDINNYLGKEHPLQQQIIQRIKELCHLDSIPETVLDGCTAPVPAMPHYNMGIGYLNLFLDPKYEDIKIAMSQNAYLVGGEGRIDTEVIQESGGKLIAKVATGGMCIVINPKEKKVLIVRVTDADQAARAIAVRDMIKKLGWDK